MFWITIKRIIKAGFISFWRNGSVSLSAVFVMIVALFMIGSTLLITAFLGTALKDLQDKIDRANAGQLDNMQIQQIDTRTALEILQERVAHSAVIRSKKI